METNWEEIFEERERKPEKIKKLISDTIYSYNKFANTHEECDILAKEIFDKLKENGLLGYEPPIG
jgi:hypothetical protein